MKKNVNNIKVDRDTGMFEVWVTVDGISHFFTLPTPTHECEVLLRMKNQDDPSQMLMVSKIVTRASVDFDNGGVFYGYKVKKCWNGENGNYGEENVDAESGHIEVPEFKGKDYAWLFGQTAKVKRKHCRKCGAEYDEHTVMCYHCETGEHLTEIVVDETEA